MNDFRICAVASALVLIVGILVPVLAAETTPGDLLNYPERFDHAAVTVRGMITNLRATVSRKGNPYYTFDLASGGNSVRVFSFGTSPCKDGSPATVDGRFDRVKRVSGRTFYNEIDATKVACQQ